MTSISQPEHITLRSQVYAAVRGAMLTVFALDGGLMGGHIGRFGAFHWLIGKAPNLLTYTLAILIFITGILGGSALWGVGMCRLARSPNLRRAAGASILGFAPITILLNFALLPVEPIILQSHLPVHRVFTMLFVPIAFLIAGMSSLALGRALRWGRAAPALALHVGLAAALAFLVTNLAMEGFGWMIGSPGAEERGTMITVLIVSNLGAALAGGAMLGLKLAQPQSSQSPSDNATLRP